MNRTDFETCSARFLAVEMVEKSEHTARSYSCAFRSFENFLRETGTEKIEPITITDYKAHLFSEGSGSNTVINRLYRLKSFFDWAKEKGAIEKNPISKRDIPKPQKTEYDLLTEEELEKILNSPRPKKKMEARNRAVLILLLATGLRNDELRSLRYGDLDFEDRNITVEHGKGDKKRIVAFPAVAAHAVEDYINIWFPKKGLKKNDFLFGSFREAGGKLEQKSHKMSGQNLLQCVRRATEKFCGHSVCVHALRHGATAYMDYIGVPIRTVQKNLGHSSIQTTERVYMYVLNREQNAEQITAAFDRALGA